MAHDDGKSQARIIGMRWLRFLAFNALGAALWVGTWVTLGYLAGSHIGTIYHYITQYSFYVLIALAVLLAAYIGRRMLRRGRRTTHSRRTTLPANGPRTSPPMGGPRRATQPALSKPPASLPKQGIRTRTRS